MNNNKNRSSAAPRSGAGFTLVELLIVMALTAIFLSIAIPSYHSILTQDRIVSELNDISADIEFARGAAVEHGIPVTVCPSTDPSNAAPACAGTGDWSGGWVVFTDANHNQTYSSAAGDQVLRFHRGLASGDTMTGEQGAPGALSGHLTAVTANRMGAMNTGVLSVHDADDTTAWRHCLVVPMTGTVYAQSEQQNPGVCP